jgi:hypothetical protein
MGRWLHRSLNAYRITLLSLAPSRRVAQRCIDSARTHKIQVDAFKAIDKYNAEHLMRALACHFRGTIHKPVTACV